MGENIGNNIDSCTIDGVEHINDYETVENHMQEELGVEYSYTIDTTTFEGKVVISIKRISNSAGARISVDPCDLNDMNAYILDPQEGLREDIRTSHSRSEIIRKLQHIGIIERT